MTDLLNFSQVKKIYFTQIKGKGKDTNLWLTFHGVCGIGLYHTSILWHQVGNSVNNGVGNTKLVAHELILFFVVPEKREHMCVFSRLRTWRGEQKRQILSLIWSNYKWSRKELVSFWILTSRSPDEDSFFFKSHIQKLCIRVNKRSTDLCKNKNQQQT